MISSASQSERPPRPEPTAVSESSAQRLTPPRRDLISTDGAAFLRGALMRQPEVRSEVVARGRLLAADPNYPPGPVIERIARTILASPDLANDES